MMIIIIYKLLVVSLTNCSLQLMSLIGRKGYWVTKQTVNGPTLPDPLTCNNGPTHYGPDQLLTRPVIGPFKRLDPLYPMGTQPIAHLYSWWTWIPFRSPIQI